MKSPLVIILLIPVLAAGQDNANQMTFKISPSQAAVKNAMVLTVNGITFSKSQVYPELKLGAAMNPAINFVYRYSIAAAGADKPTLLTLWHSAERGRASVLYSDEKAFQSFVLAAQSLSNLFVVAAIEYGDDYVLAICVQKYKDKTLRSLVIPLRREGQDLRLTNDLKSDPGFASLAQIAAAKLKDQFLRDFPETAR